MDDTVFVVTCRIDFETEYQVGVYTDAYKAETAIKRHIESKGGWRSMFEIEEITLDEYFGEST